MVQKIITDEEMRLVNMWQFFDRFGVLPFEKARIEATISQENMKKVEALAKALSVPKSEAVDKLLNCAEIPFITDCKPF